MNFGVMYGYTGAMLHYTEECARSQLCNYSLASSEYNNIRAKMVVTPKSVHM